MTCLLVSRDVALVVASPAAVVTLMLLRDCGRLLGLGSGVLSLDVCLQCFWALDSDTTNTAGLTLVSREVGFDVGLELTLVTFEFVLGTIILML